MRSRCGTRLWVGPRLGLAGLFTEAIKFYMTKLIMTDVVVKLPEFYGSTR